MNKSQCVIVILLFMRISIIGQLSIDASYFVSPINHKIVLAGSFGELRTTHFHAGIDIKPTTKKGGDSIYVSASGYISRIKIQSGGYGRVLYVDHPNGYTTVYAHMMCFTDSIEQYINDLQKSTHSSAIDIYPQKGKYQLNQRQYIGRIGNTGRSYGAHLHFEIRETKSEIPVNPALFGITSQDHRPPTILSISLHGLTPDWQETYHKTYIPHIVSNDNYTIAKGKISVPAWKAGVLVQGYDQMDGANNKNGIYNIQMFLDDSLQYSATVNKIGFDETKYIWSHIDYDSRQQKNITSVRCYQLPGNPLSIYKDTGHNGTFQLYTNVERNIKIISSDIEGNSTTVSFAMTREDIEPLVAESFQKMIKYNEAYKFKMGSAHISIPKFALDRNLMFKFKESQDSVIHYSIHDDKRPLFKYITVTIPISHRDSIDRQKLCIITNNNEKIDTYGGMLVGDSLKFLTNKLGIYSLHIDTIPPKITLMASKKNDAPVEFLKYKVTDELTSRGNSNDIVISTYIDGEWTICPYKDLGSILTIPVAQLSVGKHMIKIVAIDGRGNKAETSTVYELK